MISNFIGYDGFFRGLFLRQMGFSVILASPEAFGFGLFGDVMRR
jgi:hypothetical protein